jgi:hypothetical protein
MRRVSRLVAGLAVGIASGVGMAAAAEARSAHPAADPPLQVHLVRSAEPGCEPHCPEWIAAQGRIEAGSAARFRRVLLQTRNRKLPVLIDSNGGRVDEALAIGRLLRARGLDVAVSGTAFTSCAQADAHCRGRARSGQVRLGVPKVDLAMCASSCAFILAAGKRRLVGPTTYVGVHQIRSFYIYAKIVRTYRVTGIGKQLLSERRVTERVVETRTPQRTYDQIRRYFGEMGIGEGLMSLLLATPGDRLHWLTPEELRATGLATEGLGGEELLATGGRPLHPRSALQGTGLGDGLSGGSSGVSSDAAP